MRYLSNSASILLVLMFGTANAADRIGDIAIVGNESTRPSVILHRLDLERGDPVDFVKIQSSVQSVMDLSLFRHVTYELDYRGNDGVDDIYDLTLFVEEKYYLLVIPMMRFRDNQFRTGVRVKADNLFGLNHKLKYVYEMKGKYQGERENRQTLSYEYPLFLGSENTLSIGVNRENNVNDQADGSYLDNMDDSLFVGMRFWLDEDARSYGKYIDLSASLNNRDQEDVATNLLVNSVSSTTVGFGIGEIRSHVHQFNRTGREYGYDLQVASQTLGSDTSYIEHRLFYRNYLTFDSRPYDNLNLQAVIGHATDDVLGDKAFVLDFRNDLRGYDRGRFSGNSVYLVNVEYLMASDSSPNLHYVGFLDAGATSDDIDTILEQRVNFGVGLGIRWKIPAFVNVDLRLDIGYGISDENVQATFGTNHAF